jgi:uncharacterized protein involved in outer membrane biogenesis
MRWLLGGLLALLAIITLSVAILVYLVPDSAIERHILSAAGRATDTRIETGGPPEITLFPSIDMTLRDISVRPKDREKPALKADELRAQVSWISLLTTWTVDVFELHIDRPELQLPGPGEENLERAAASPRLAPRYPVPSLSVGQITIENGSISGLGENWRIGSVDARIPGFQPKSPVEVELDMILNGERVAGNVRLKDPSALAEGGKVPLTAKLGAATGVIEVDGTASVDGSDPTFQGEVKIDTADIDRTARWLGSDAMAAYKGAATTIDGEIAYTTDEISIRDADINFDGTTAKVSGRIEKSGPDYSAREVVVAGLDPKVLGLPENARISNLEARFARLQEGGPVEADLEFSMNGEPVSGRATVPNLDLLTGPSGEPFPAKGSFAIPGGGIEFDARISRPGKSELESASGWALNGHVRMTTDSARKTAGLLALELPEGDGFGAAEFEGEVAADARSIAVSDAHIALDGAAATGSVSVNLSAEKPVVSAKLDIDKLDTAPYLYGGEKTVRVAQLESAPAAPYKLYFAKLKPSLEAYLAKGSGGPAAEQHLERLTPTVDAIWSQASTGVDRLREVGSDIDLDLKVGELSHGALFLGKTSLVAKVRNSALDLEIREAQPLKGRLTGSLKVDASPAKPAYALAVDIDGVPVGELLRQAGQRDIIRGELTGSANLAAKGETQSDVVDSLEGSVNSEFRNGVIVGYDVRRAVRRFSAPPYNPGDTTSYDVIRADFTIADGVARSSKISLDGPEILFKAKGSANLKTSKIDYESDLSLVPPPALIAVPLDLSGTWRSIKAAIDWARAVTAWTGPLPFDGLESVRRTDIGDPELQALVGELMAKEGDGKISPKAADLLRLLVGKND